jgi:hypothetical protein
MEVYKGIDGRWHKPCFECGEDQSYSRKHYAFVSFELKKTCKKCSNRKIENSHRGWHRGVRISWVNKIILSAKNRKIDFNLTIDDIADVYEKQQGKCSLTGWDIVFPEVGIPQNADASLDRIDSKKPYQKDNIQIVHKLVNMMKSRYSQEQFIEVCKAVADKVKW